MTEAFLKKPNLVAGLPNMTFFRLIIVMQIVAALSACATTAPRYTPDLAASEELEKQALGKMRVGEFSSATPDVEKITIRGGTFNAPGGSSFANYLRMALQDELVMAGIWDESSSISISGILLENDLDASGINTGIADLSAEFIVTVNSSEVYRNIHSIHHEWESSFAGAVAISRAHDNYVIAVRMLLSELFTDPNFLRAVGAEPSR